MTEKVRINANVRPYGSRPGPRKEAVHEGALCPICGESITLLDDITTNGRLIGSCGDAFTEAQFRQ